MMNGVLLDKNANIAEDDDSEPPTPLDRSNGFSSLSTGLSGIDEQLI